MVKVKALTNFTKQALLDSTKAIQALNEEQIQTRKAVIQNKMALDILTAAQGGTCANVVCISLTCLKMYLLPWRIYKIKLKPCLMNCCYSNLDHTALWALLPTMPCEFCNPEVDSILSCGWQEG